MSARQVADRLLETLRPLQAKQISPRHEQVRQGTGHDEPVQVLRQAAIAHLGEPEDAFDDADRVLDLGTHPRLPSILLALDRAQRSAPVPFVLGEVLGVGRTPTKDRRLARGGRVAPDALLAAVQQPGSMRLSWTFAGVAMTE